MIQACGGIQTIIDEVEVVHGWDDWPPGIRCISALFSSQPEVIAA